MLQSSPVIRDSWVQAHRGMRQIWFGWLVFEIHILYYMHSGVVKNNTMQVTQCCQRSLKYPAQRNEVLAWKSTWNEAEECVCSFFIYLFFWERQVWPLFFPFKIYLCIHFKSGYVLISLFYIICYFPFYCVIIKRLWIHLFAINLRMIFKLCLFSLWLPCCIQSKVKSLTLKSPFNLVLPTCTCIIFTSNLTCWLAAVTLSADNDSASRWIGWNSRLPACD